MQYTFLTTAALAALAIAAPSPKSQNESVIVGAPVTWADVEAGAGAQAHVENVVSVFSQSCIQEDNFTFCFPWCIESNTNDIQGKRAVKARAAGVSPADGGPACEGPGNFCTGDVTYYDPAGGYSACGTMPAAGSFTVSMPVGMMGPLSNTNPYCGRSVTVRNPTTGVTVVATVQDKCMGCVGRSIDLTPGLFNAVASGVNGRGHGFTWWFN